MLFNISLALMLAASLLILLIKLIEALIQHLNNI